MSADGKLIIFSKDSSLYLANADGSNVHVLASVPGGVTGTNAFSPDGNRVRFTVDNPVRNTSSLWEVGVDGSNAHPLLPEHNLPLQCCGRWTLDGNYYFFVSGDNSHTDIFALREKGDIFRRTFSKPVQLTTGPLLYFSVLPSSDNKKLFVQGTQQRTQVVRYDPKTRQFVPYLSGISATDLTFSRDGQWVAYVTIPEGNLWRSRVDGSERLQLTYSPLQPVLPQWSPDGQQLAYINLSLGQPVKAQIVSAQGGAPEDLSPENGVLLDFNWLPDGNQMIVGSGPGAMEFFIYTLDLKTHKLSKIPGSDRLFSPRLSPDGRYLAALSSDSSTLMLYDLRTQKWEKWFKEPGNLAYITWSKESTYIYFDNFLTNHPSARRVKLGADHSEELFSLAGLRRFVGQAGVWGGSDPNGDRLYVQDLSVQEIYALDVDLP